MLTERMEIRNMITLCILGIIFLVFVFALVALAGGFLVIFIDPIIAVLIIWLCVKLIDTVEDLTMVCRNNGGGY